MSNSEKEFPSRQLDIRYDVHNCVHQIQNCSYFVLTIVRIVHIVHIFHMQIAWDEGSHVPVEEGVDHSEELLHAGRDLLALHLVLPDFSSCCCCFLHPVETKVYDRTLLDI